MGIVRRIGGALAAVALLVPFSASAHPEHADAEITTIRSFGTYSLRRLGHPDPLVLRNDPPAHTAAVPFGLPAGAHQGPDTWYVLHLRAHVSLPTDAGGISYVRAATNGRFAALLKFDAREFRDLGIIRMTTANFEQGAYSTEYRSTEIDVEFVNHLQQQGVKEGRNTLTFDTTSIEGGRIESVTIQPITTLEYTRRSPHNLSLRPVVENHRIAVGDSFDVGYELQLRDPSTPADRVGVSASVEGGGVEVIGKGKHDHPKVSAPTTGAFRFLAKQVGTWDIELSTTSAGAANSSKATIRATVVSGGSQGTPVAVLAGAGFAAVLGSYLLFGRRRKRVTATTGSEQ